MRHPGFKAKLLYLVGFAWFGLLLLGMLNALSTRQLLMQEREAALAEQVQSAVSVVKYYVHQAQTGAMSMQDAKSTALKSLRAVRYGQSGYLLVNDSHLLQILNPARPELENRINETIDPTGKHIVADIVKHDVDGTHLTQYVVAKPGQTALQPKLAYSDYVREWDWHVFTGAYIDDIDRTFHRVVLKSMLIVIAIGTVLTLGMAYLIRGVLGSIGGDPQDVAAICARIAAGDLSQHIDLASRDRRSLLHSVKTMQDQLIATIGQIRRVANAITSASREIANGHNDLSSRTEEQAASLSETAANMEQLTSTVRFNSDHAHDASKLARDTSTTVQDSNAIVRDVETTMDRIAQGSARIFEIVGMIESIAFQTNILALNAAVEAARAGEQGRGFAVVATEVRTLAQRSAGAAKDVKALVDESKAEIVAGQQLAHRSGASMQHVLVAANHVTDIMGEISSASTQQTQGIEQIGIAVTQMENITQQNAALVEEATAAAVALAEQADELMRTVEIFRLQA